MKKILITIILLIVGLWQLSAQTGFSGESATFTVDTKKPEVTLNSPNGGGSFINTLPIEITWIATDDSFGGTPISAGLSTEEGGDVNWLGQNLANSGTKSVSPPQAVTLFAKAHIKAVDAFGNEAVDMSDGYFELLDPCQNATANAGDDAEICENESFQLNGQAENYTSILWETGGDGTFSNSSSLSATYYPGTMDIVTGTTELCLTAFAEDPCEDATDCLSLSMNSNPFVNAGEDQTILETESITLNGQVQNSDEFQWSTNGDGNFNNPTMPNATYQPGDNDNSSGQVVLILTAQAIAPCEIAVNDEMLLTIIPESGCTLPAAWTFYPNPNSLTIGISLAVNPNIFGEPLANGDWIGAFYEDDWGDLKCGGAIQWDGTVNIGMIIFGDDMITSEKDGFAVGEEIKWKLFSCENQTEFDAIATYMSGNGTFTPGGFAQLSSLQAVLNQLIALAEGWNGVSLFIDPIDPQVENIFGDQDDFIIMQNLTSMYWPDYSINMIGDWDLMSGYAIKVLANTEIDLPGTPSSLNTITLSLGWHYLPVLSPCSANTQDLLDPEKVIFARDLVGFGVYWPSAGIYALEHFEPGKSYSIKVSEEFTISFPDCGLKEVSIVSKTINKSTSVWGSYTISPVSHAIRLEESARKTFSETDQIGVFAQDGQCYGAASINELNHNVLLIHGDDPTTIEKDGFIENEIIIFKIWNSINETVVIVEVEFNQTFQNFDYRFHKNGLSSISSIKTLSIGDSDIASNETIHLYPNPASEQVTIVSEYIIKAKIEIMNQLGEVCITTQSTTTKTTLDISSLKPGIYLVSINSDKHNIVKKLVVE